MLDFTAIAPALRQSADLDRKLRELGFHCAEQLSPSLSKKHRHATYASEIWLREVGGECQAVRIDWRGHPHLPSNYAGHRPHVHFEIFPASARSAYLLGRLPGGLVKTFSAETGLTIAQ